MLEIYRLTDTFPKSGLFPLTSQNAPRSHFYSCQYRRRFQKTHYTQTKSASLNVAQGSLEESQFYRILTRDLDYADTSFRRPQLDEVSKMLDAYVRAIERNFHSSRSSP